MEYLNNPKNMGKVNRFFVANGLSELREYSGRNISPFSNMDGEIKPNLEYSEIRGRKRIRKKRKPVKRKKNWEKVLEYTPIGMAKKGVDSLTSEDAKSRRLKRQLLRQGLKERRLSLKEKQAETQQELAKTMNQPSATEEALTQALTESTPTNTEVPKPNPSVPETTVPTGMKKTTKIILIVGGIAVALTATILIIRKMRKK